MRRRIRCLVLLWLCTVGVECGTVSTSSDESTDGKLCRTVHGYLPQKLFESFTCGTCFFHTFNDHLKLKYELKKCFDGVLICSQQQVESDNRSPDINATKQCHCDAIKNIYNFPEFNKKAVPLDELPNRIGLNKLPNNFLEMTRACCNEAKLCCENTASESILLNDSFNISDNNMSLLQCPKTWDGWQCFGPTEAGKTVRNVCPYYMYGLPSITSNPDSEEYYSLKECQKDGTWFKPNQTNIEWTDYNKCSTLSISEQEIKRLVGVCAFAVSVVAIIPAIGIFCAYRTLQVDRITIHKHLLLSFLLTGLLYIFNNMFFISNGFGAGALEANHLVCRLLFLVQLRYLRLTNYMWMLCEGFYLYKFLFDAFSQKNSLVVYYLLGWVFPIIPTVLYAGLRVVLDDQQCWIIPNVEWIDWITYGPCIVSLAVNFFLMINILRVLITKLRHSPEPTQYRKAVRATLVLLPIFGLHFFITIYRLNYLWYEIINKLLDGLQGFIVALIICYTHGEVLELLKNTWRIYRMQQTCEREMRRSRKSFQVEHELSLLS